MAMIGSWSLAALGAVAFWRPPHPTTRMALLPLLAPLAAGLAGAAITFGTTRYRSAGRIGLVVLGALGIEVLVRLAGAPPAARVPPRAAPGAR